MTKTKKNWLIALISCGIALCVVTAAGSAYIGAWLNRHKLEPELPPSPDLTLLEEEEELDPHFGTVYSAADSASLKGFVREWWDNHDKSIVRYSKDVVNVLLIGVDNDEGKVGVGRSDSMMLVSVNKKQNKITMLSFLRDSYCYMNINGKEWYHKLNSTYYLGGAVALMDQITRLYKIRIDQYVTVDFASFPKIIDALGGVRVDVSDKEAKYINRTAPSQKGKFPSGPKALLTGKQALIYSRIRKLDTDMARVDRQQKILESLFHALKGSSLGQLKLVAEQTLPYIKTNFTHSELFGLLPSAVSWLSYDIVHLQAPDITSNDPDGVDMTINQTFFFVVDYPRAARRVQLALYGDSNIILDESGERAAHIRTLFHNVQEYKSTTTRAQTESESDNYESSQGISGGDLPDPGDIWGNGETTQLEPSTDVVPDTGLFTDNESTSQDSATNINDSTEEHSGGVPWWPFG